jgi:hypothetical protein
MFFEILNIKPLIHRVIILENSINNFHSMVKQQKKIEPKENTFDN